MRAATAALDREPMLLRSTDPAFPPELCDLGDPPAALWWLGTLATLEAPRVAIVGTRGATPYGERMARELAGALARAGICIVSGLARGIDATAHRAALAAGGRTVAVLGTGVDVSYPVGHRELHEEIATRGLVLAEQPPGSRAFRGSFPRRNRIIAALAHATLVIEAPVKSGALNTAGHALTLGRQIGVVPGPIDSPACAGSNALLRDGAAPVLDVGDAFGLAGVSPQTTRMRVMPDGDAGVIWTALGAGALDIEAILGATGLPAARCMAAITELELAGAVECELTGEIRRR